MSDTEKLQFAMECLARIAALKPKQYTHAACAEALGRALGIAQGAIRAFAKQDLAEVMELRKAKGDL